MKKTILYLCTNDGSDMRINKELKTIHCHYDIIYLGIGTKSNLSFAEEFSKEFYLIPGKVRNIRTVFKYYITLFRLLKKKYHAVHVVEEQLLILIFPIIITLKEKVILDIFDSLFLKLCKPNNKAYIFKKIIYSLPEKIIVTDNDRQKLLPKFAQKKSVVINNYPLKESYKSKHINNQRLHICYFGSLAKDRGSEFAFNLMQSNKNIYFSFAGWITDTYTENLLSHPRINYIGIKKQIEINDFLSEHGDYLLSIYPSNNTNNIYASPNKVYDCIHTKTPIIINSQVKISNFIKDNNLGFVFELNNKINYDLLAKELFKLRNSYDFTNELIDECSWNRLEKSIINIYN